VITIRDSKRTRPAPPRAAYRLRGVEVFAAGQYRGKTYTPADLDDMVRNFRQSSTGSNPRLRVPAVIGHDEDQELLERSDLPAAGWATRLYRDGPILKADFDDVAPQVARLLRGKAYRKVSAEVYDSPQGAGLPGQGKMLRRVALLGGDIPQVKTLADIPTPEPGRYSESPSPAVQLRPTTVRATARAGLFIAFAEVHPRVRRNSMKRTKSRRRLVTKFVEDTDPQYPGVSRADLLQQLGALGLDVGVFQDVEIPALAEVLRALQERNDDGAIDEDTAGRLAEEFFDRNKEAIAKTFGSSKTRENFSEVYRKNPAEAIHLIF
jgi:hypothetical protein